MFEYLLGLLGRLAERQPCVLVVEDAQWADRSSRDLLEFLIRSQQATPGLMIVVTHRSAELEPAHPLRRQLAELSRLPWVERVDLDRLSRRDVVRQARAILGREPDPELIGTVYGRSGGNPLFVEALLACHLDGVDCRVPPTLADLLLEHVRRLPGPAARVVRTASVAGKRIGHPLLANVIRRSTVSSSDVDDLDGALRDAVEATVLTVDGDGYAFRHALIRDAVYAALLPGERARLHGHYADAISDDERLAARGQAAAEIAHHLFSSHDTGRGVVAAWRASQEAHQAHAYAEELALLECILHEWSGLPDPATALGVSRVDLMERAVDAAMRSGAHIRGEDLATAALAELDPERERVRTALMLKRRGTMRSSLGLPSALDDLREAVRVIPDDHPARAGLLDALADQLLWVPLPAEANDVASEAVQQAQRHGDAAAEASALITLAILEARVGRLDAQLPQFARARAIAETVGAVQVTLRSWHSESHLVQAYGRLDVAAEIARAGLAAATKAGLARALGPAHVIDLVGALIGAGRWNEAIETIEYGLTLAPPPIFQAHLLSLKGFIALHRGDTDATESILARVAELLPDDRAFRQDPVLFERLEAELRLAQGRAGEARAIVREVLGREGLLPATRFVWPMLVIGAGVAAALPDAERDELLADLRAWANRLGTNTPVQVAWRHTFEAATGGDWDAAVRSWQDLRQPLRSAQVLTESAEATLARTGDRESVADALKQASDLAASLDASPLRDRIASLARRARISLNGHRPPDGSSTHGLTPRELEILRLVADGRSNSEIAGELFIAPKTASVHVSHILAKLEVGNRVEAAAAAHRLGILEPAP